MSCEGVQALILPISSARYNQAANRRDDALKYRPKRLAPQMLTGAFRSVSGAFCTAFGNRGRISHVMAGYRYPYHARESVLYYTPTHKMKEDLTILLA